MTDVFLLFQFFPNGLRIPNATFARNILRGKKNKRQNK